jgi:Flp pilus assembly protein TadD
MAITVGLLVWKKWQTKTIAEFTAINKTPLLVLVSGVVLISLYWGTPYSPSLKNALQPPATPQPAAIAPVVNRLDIGGTDSGEIRKIVWQGAIKVWQRYPIFGSGLETFAYSYYQDRPLAHNLVSEWDFLYNKAHNEFLNFLATTGIVGLLSYVILLGYFSWFSFTKLISAKNTNSQALIFASILGAVAALSVSNFFGFSTVMVTVLLYLFFAIPAVLTGAEEESVKTVKELSSSSYLLLSATGLFCIFFLRVIFQYWSADVDYTKGKAYLEAGYLEQGVELLNTATAKNSQEATFYDELANQYALYAVAYAQQEQTAQAQALMIAADEMAQTVHKLNPRQLNFYKTRTRVYITLAQIKPEYLETAKQILVDARSLAPTDPKLVYNLGIVEISLSDIDGGIASLKEAVELKPNYESARLQLAIALEGQGKTDQALEQYRYIVENINPTHEEAQAKIASLSAELETKN